jgi:hypothetical protein
MIEFVTQAMSASPAARAIVTQRGGAAKVDSARDRGLIA